MSETRKSGLVTILVGSLIASLLACGTFAYLWIDRSIRLTYAELSSHSTGQARDLAFLLLAEEWASLSEDQVLRRLEAETARRPQDKIFVKHEPLEHFIWFGNTRFEFQADRLAKIQ
jgi:hypothetical protein